MTDAIWKPDEFRADASLLGKFMVHLGHAIDQPFADYEDLRQWSISSADEFWRQVAAFCGLIFEGDDGLAIERSQDMRATKFFPNVKLNYAENILSRERTGEVLVFENEAGERRSYDMDQLKSLVSKVQQALIEAGVKQGDRVAGVMPNCPETIAFMLGVTSLGAVWSSCSPDFGASGVTDRFSQIEPQIIFGVDGYHYNGKRFDCLDVIAEVYEKVPSLKKIVIFPFAGADAETTELPEGCEWLDDFLNGFEPQEITFERVGFREPLFIMFSSGTTGLPKCIIHSVGGTLLQHLKEHQLHSDIRANDKLFYFTTCGWMMWNWLSSGLASSATLLLFDGNPFYPDGNRLPEYAAREGATHFGASAKLYEGAEKAGIRPKEILEASPLRVILSTGSPLSEQGFEYLYRDWHSDVMVSSIAGGTDILGCFFAGNPTGAVYSGACMARALGMDVQIFDDEGNASSDGAGELVCLNAHPSMPIGFWNDADDERYRDAYFAKYPGIWRHGDWVEITPEGGGIFHGRSDTTLNPGGVRIGTAEIYREVEKVDEVLEGLVIGQKYESDVRVVLFVKMRDGFELDDEIIKRIKTVIRTNASPRHVPAIIVAVPDLPRTKSGKITEIAVRDIVHGRDVKNTEALLNPESLKYFNDLPQLQL